MYYMNVSLRGKTMQILESMIAKGYANTKSEAIRLAIINFAKENLSEEELVSRKIERIEKQVKNGKRKVLNAEQALGKYAKYLK